MTEHDGIGGTNGVQDEFPSPKVYRTLQILDMDIAEGERIIKERKGIHDPKAPLLGMPDVFMEGGVAWRQCSIITAQKAYAKLIDARALWYPDAVDSAPKSKVSLREHMARAICSLNGYDPDSTSFEHGLKFWQVAARDIDAALDVLDTVDHAFLDAARDGLPMESGLAAKFWKAAIRVLKEGK